MKNYQRCPYQIDDQCWCEKAMDKFHNVPPVVKPMRGKMVTCSWIDELATEENAVDWGRAVEEVSDNQDALIEDIIGGLFDV